MSDRSFKNCGSAVVTKKGEKVIGWFCKNKRWSLQKHDIGTGLCPCKEWVKIIEKKSPAREWTQPGLFD